MITHQQIKFIQSLKMKKNRSDFFVVEGEKMNKELLASSFDVEQIYHTQKVDIQHPKAVLVSEKEMSRMSHFKTHSTVLSLVKKVTYSPKLDETKLQIALDDIKDPGNLGTIIRIADWFGIDTVLCSLNTVDVYNPKTIQSSMGSIFRVRFSYSNLNQTLKDSSISIIGAFLEGKNIYEETLPKCGVLIIGNESNGISDDLSRIINHPITIPRFGGGESLNAAVACGVICSELRRS